MRSRTLAASVLALSLGLAAAPVQAGGSFTYTFIPHGKAAEIVRDGLQLYALGHELRNKAKVDQRGSDNSAGISQDGSGNTAGIFQRGHGHSATISQNGDNNTLGIFQFGRGTSTSATQTGNGKVGLVFQGGW